MILKNVLEFIGVFSDDSTEAMTLQIDSRKVKEGDIFLAYEGHNHDGNSFIDEAFINGAVAVISDKYSGDRIYHCPTIKDERNRLAAYFYNEPYDDLTIIGVTGTNGKTSTASCIYQMLVTLDVKVMLIGTNGVFSGDYKEELDNTTPDGVILARLFYNAKVLNCTHVIMEVSSHSLALKRVSEIKFSGAIFTNISHEHLDFHHTIDEYAKTKSELFCMVKTNGFCIVNNDDKYAQLMKEQSKGMVSTFGTTSDCNYFINQCHLTRNQSVFNINSQQVKTNLVSKFNVYNVTACYAALKCLGFRDEQILPSLAHLSPISGRMECIYQSKYSAFIDFAHTPDALEKVLSFMRPICNGKIIAVFGCGGNRDRTKRPKMGEVVGRLADKVIVTSDNPRYENPKVIIDETLQGLKKYENKTFSYLSRSDAIVKAISLAEPNDIILLFGKGQENYQIIKDFKIPYNDKEVFNQCLSKH